MLYNLIIALIVLLMADVVLAIKIIRLEQKHYTQIGMLKRDLKEAYRNRGELADLCFKLDKKIDMMSRRIKND